MFYTTGALDFSGEDTLVLPGGKGSTSDLCLSNRKKSMELFQRRKNYRCRLQRCEADNTLQIVGELADNVGCAYIILLPSGESLPDIHEAIEVPKATMRKVEVCWRNTRGNAAVLKAGDGAIIRTVRSGIGQRLTSQASFYVVCGGKVLRKSFEELREWYEGKPPFTIAEYGGGRLTTTASEWLVL